MPVFAAADLISLLVVAAFYIIGHILKKRREAQGEPLPPEEGHDSSPAPLPQRETAPPQSLPRSTPIPNDPASQPSRPASSWEKEIEELLQKELGLPPTSESEVPRSPSPPPPPPPFQPTAPPPLPATTRRLPETKEGPVRNPVTLRRADEVERRAEQLDARTEERLARVSSNIGSLEAAAIAYNKGGQIQSKVTDHFRQIPETPVGLTQAGKPSQSSLEIREALALLRNPRTTRQAIIASVILGPPKSMEG